MEQAAYLIISFIVLLLSFFLFKKASGTMSITRLNMLSYLFYIPLVLMSFLGAIFIVLDIDNHYLINKLKYNETRQLVWLAILYTMLMLPIGMILAKQFFFRTTAKVVLNEFSKSPIHFLFGKYEKLLKWTLMGLTIVCLFALVYTLLSIDKIPLFEFLKGSGSDLSRLRIQASKEFSGNVYLRNIFAIQFLPLLTFVWFAYFQKNKTWSNLFWFLAAFFGAVLILTYDFQKSPLAMFLGGFLFYYIWVYGRVSTLKVGLAGFTFITVIVLFYMGLRGETVSDILLNYNEGAPGRILFSQVAGTYFSFEMFDATHDFIGVSSLSKFVEYFGFEHSERAGRLIVGVSNRQGFIDGTAGVQNTLFLGEAWANFGLLGVLLSPLYVGFIIGALFYTFLRLPKTPLFIGIYTFFSYKTVLIGGFNDYIYNMGNFLMLLVLLLLLIFSNQLRLKLTKPVL